MFDFMFVIVLFCQNSKVIKDLGKNSFVGVIVVVFTYQ